MGEQKVGALIVLTGHDPLEDIVGTGTILDATISKPLIENIFFKNSPLHDGAVIIRGGRVVAARCTLPITDRTDIPARYGMRHKAAIGITEKTDARVIVVSEQTGEVSFAADGIITKMEGKSMLKLRLGDDGQKTGNETGV
jgi:DNA integrity scanning protein DisA with diadenylate cyclase activity